MVILYPKILGLSIVFPKIFGFYGVFFIMYESRDIAERIKLTAKAQQVKIKTMLEECQLSKNTLSSMLSGGSLPKSDTLAKIADYLDVSVDYLLGLTDIPDTKKAVGISADSPDDNTEKAIAYLNYLAQANPEALQKAAEYAKFLAQDNQ